MAYATLSDLQALWGANDVLISSDWDNSGVLNTTNVTSCLAYASDEMDRYVAVRYVVPLLVVPDDLVRVCCDIAMYRLANNASTLTEQKATRYKEAVGFLRDLSTGKATLGAKQDSQDPATPSEIETAISGTALTRVSLQRLL
jgi:phage gp36-like protein